jgi:hypothetical protein
MENSNEDRLSLLVSHGVSMEAARRIDYDMLCLPCTTQSGWAMKALYEHGWTLVSELMTDSLTGAGLLSGALQELGMTTC